ncbi:MAG TPA: translocation/assembly module TamB domain-containing protein [Bacteroidota bacterium]|nr:translocation/assembly module TamB domain-containing protein [Bacteroidota bacterium]
MRILKRILKITGVIVAGIIFLVLAATLFTQTTFFRDRFRTLIASGLENQINGTIYVGNIGGNLITGFTVDSVSVSSAQGIFFNTGRIFCQYEPVGFFSKRARLRYLIVDHPSIHFVRMGSGQWNTDLLFKHDTVQTAGEFDWNLFLDHVELKHGRVEVIDSVMLADSARPIEMRNSFQDRNFVINDINILSKGTIQKNDLTVEIIQASGYSPQTKFELSVLKGTFIASDRGTFARGVLIQTTHSLIDCDASLQHANLLGGFSLEQLRQDSIHLFLRARTLDLHELKSFLPELEFLHGNISFNLDANGEFGDFAVKRLQLAVASSSLTMSGSIRNLHRPGDLALGVVVTEARLHPRDIHALLPEVDLPRMDSTGLLILNGEFSGKPQNFRVKSDVKGPFGSVELSGNLDLEHAHDAYTATFTTHHLDIGPFVSDRKFHTILNGKGSVAGHGFSVNNLTGSLTLNADSSRIQSLEVSSFNCSVQAEPHRIVADARASNATMNADIHAQAAFEQSAAPQYSATASLSSFDLSTLLNDPKYSTNLTLEGKFSGSGRTIEDFNAECNLSLLPSAFEGHPVTSQEIHLTLDQSDVTHKRLSLRSGIVDADVRGKFDLDLTTASLVYQVDNLLSTIRSHALPADSEVAEQKPVAPSAGNHTAAQKELNCSYDIHIKDLEPLADLFKSSPFDAKASFKGTLTGSTDRISMTCDGTFHECYFGTVKGGMLLNDGVVHFVVDSLADSETLEHLAVSLELTAASGKLNAKTLDGITLSLLYRNFAGKFSLRADVDTALAVTATGNASVEPHTYVFDFDTLRLALRGYTWLNDQDVQCRLDYDGFRIMRGVMKRNEEQFSLTGMIDASGAYDVNATLRRFNLSGIGYLTANPEFASRTQGFFGRADADLHLSGTAESPVIALDLGTENAHYRETDIGTVRAHLEYANQLMHMDVAVRGSARDTVARLSVQGSLPIDLAFAGVEERFPDAEEHIEVRSAGFDVSVIDPLLTDFDDLSGKIQSSVVIGGTPHHPEFSGSIVLQDLEFLFVPNNIPYAVSGELEPQGDKIQVKSLHIRDIRPNTMGNEAVCTGSVSVRDFQVGDLNLLLNGQLLLMTDASRRKIPTMYGTLLAETETGGLQITGNLDAPLLTGKFSILEANLTFPPAANAQAASSNLALPYVLIDDTTKALRDTMKLSRFYAVNDTATTDSRSARNVSSPLLDRLRYNLVVETKGITAVRMIFTPTMNEELYAELEGSVTAVKSAGSPTIYGEIEVGSRSYYTFYKKFDATGKLRFVGQWDDPELDIQATYQGTRQLTETQTPEQEATSTTPRTTEQAVMVQLTISGSRLNPKLDMAMKVQLHPGAEWTDWSTQAKGGDPQSDIISFIVWNKFRDQLTSKEQQDLTNIGSSAGSSVASNLLSGIFSTFLREEFSFIRDVDVSYQGGTFQEGTNVNITTSAGIGQLRVGGKIFNDIGNTNLTYQINLVRNLFLEIQRKVTSENTEDKRLTNEARLFYRFAF